MGKKNIITDKNVPKKKSLKGLVIISAAFLIMTFIGLLALFIYLTKEDRSEKNKPLSDISLSSDTVCISGGIYYDMVSGFSHNLSVEELSYIKDLINKKMDGSKISFTEYNTIISSISDNSVKSLDFLELNDDTGAIYAEIMLYEGNVYVEKTDNKGEIYVLSSDDAKQIITAFEAFKVLKNLDI